MAYAVKIENGRAKLYENGSYKRSVGSHVSAASVCEDFVAVIENGRARQYKISGSSIRYVGDRGAVDVSINMSTVLVRYANGKTKEYKTATGTYIRTY